MEGEIRVRFTGIAEAAASLSGIQQTLAQAPELHRLMYGSGPGSEALSEARTAIAAARQQLSELADAVSEAVASTGIAFQLADSRIAAGVLKAGE